MHKQTSAKLILFSRLQNKILVVLFVVAGFVSLVSPLFLKQTDAATSSTINFQARLLQANGAVVPDGYYNVQFNLYNVSSAGSALWSETYYDSNGVTAGSDNRIKVVNGYLTTSLGSATAFPSINWDQELWLTMNIGGSTQTATPTWDGEMNPRLKFTASPYAFSAGKLQTSSGANTSTLGFVAQTASRSLLLPDESGTLCVQSATSCGFATSSGSANYIQNGTSPQTASFSITGNATIGTTAIVNQGIFVNNTGGIARAAITQTGVLEFGSGTATRDVNLYRSAADTLKTDDTLEVGGNVNVTGTLGVSSTSNSFILGALGLGTASPQTGSALTIANGVWMSGLDAAGSGYINLFQVNSSNEIQVGAALNVDGGIILPTNGGQITLVDLPIDSTAANGAAQSYTFRVGSTNALTVYGQADGAGNAQNVRVAIGSGIAPGYTLDVTGDINSTTAIRVAGTSICTSSGCTPTSGSANYIQNGTGQQASSNFNISGAGVVGTTLAVNGSSVTTTSTTMSLFNTGATTLNLAGAATTISVGASSGTTTLNGKVSVGAGAVAARLAVTATNNGDTALYARTTNAAGYGAALQVTNGTIDYLNIGAYGAAVFNLAASANVAQAYRFNTAAGAGIILDMNAQQQSVGIGKAAPGSTYSLDVNGATNATNYYKSGTLLNSSHLSDSSSLARLNTTNTLTSSSALIVTNGTTNGIVVDTQNNRVGIGTTGAPGNYALDVANIFQVDKTNNRLIVGTWGGDTSGTLTVLGSKTTIGDPTGVVGAMYFNVSLKSFRCYNSATYGWQDCGPQTRKLTADASSATTSIANLGNLNFAVAANTDYSLSCNLVYQTVASTATGPVVSLDGPASPVSVTGMFNSFAGAALDTPVGYGFNAYDGGAGLSSVPATTTPYSATFNATFRNGATAGTLALRLKTYTAGLGVTIKAGSSCQMTSL